MAKKFEHERKKVENITVFSNVLNRDTTKEIFFFKKWQEGYSKFKRHNKIRFRFD
ncbi:hypothetical protein MBAV_000842 [Candidatus Magnetobacterium bavaricum]|uniref:Uncharacterized protein n=1 Tax=Candidatus Magnetobacterium bavaricum TaxID=29290 RepID=A0A0F3GYI6_9BACT|nr:hypothetical protein MBAV_000842 [Candidatus Magnetobacterium bavaricum]